MLLIDIPSPFAPETELRTFLSQWGSGPDKDLPEVKAALEKVKGYPQMLKDARPPTKADFGKVTAASVLAAMKANAKA